MGISPVTAVGLAADLAANEKVRALISAAANGIYGRIFTKKSVAVDSSQTLQREPTELELLKQMLASQPSNIEMGLAFASLQVELRRGQQRISYGLIGIAAVNLIILVITLIN